MTYLFRIFDETGNMVYEKRMGPWEEWPYCYADDRGRLYVSGRVDEDPLPPGCRIEAKPVGS